MIKCALNKHPVYFVSNVLPLSVAVKTTTKRDAKQKSNVIKQPLPQRSLMTADEKDMIDLEVTSFMTACAAGVDALKALLQRERLRRMEQEASVRGPGDGGGNDDDVGFDGVMGSGGGAGGAGAGGLRPGSRPAHEHVAVTFLFERLKAVTSVAETMQVIGQLLQTRQCFGFWCRISRRKCFTGRRRA